MPIQYMYINNNHRLALWFHQRTRCCYRYHPTWCQRWSPCGRQRNCSQRSYWLRSVRNDTRRKPSNVTTPKYIPSNDDWFRWPSATRQALCLPSCLPSSTRWNLIFLYPGGDFVFNLCPRSSNVSYSLSNLLCLPLFIVHRLILRKVLMSLDTKRVWARKGL